MLGNTEYKSILLPKQHLSWSQIQIWKSSPERYRREYFENGRKLDTKYLRFGSFIAKMVEDGSHKLLLPTLTVYDKPEYEIKSRVKHIVPILCYLDGYDPTFGIFGEYKTGKIPWTLAKVQKHDQLTFYAMTLRIETGIMPEWCELHWIETREDSDSGSFFGNDAKVVTTGTIQTFRRYFDERELDRMEEETIKVALEISEAYKAFLSEL